MYANARYYADMTIMFMKRIDEQCSGNRVWRAVVAFVVAHTNVGSRRCLLPFNLMTYNKATRKMTADEPRGCSVCETPGHRQLITSAIKDSPSLTSNYFSKRS